MHLVLNHSIIHGGRDGFAFASEIKPLLSLPGVCRVVQPQRLYSYLRYGVTDDGNQTLFAGIDQLPAAHSLCLSLDTPGSINPQRYWSIALEQQSELSFDQASETLRELFLENVRLHLRSDVPVGSALSGGIDSSSIVAAMRQVEGDDLALHTFSYVAASSELGEEHWGGYGCPAHGGDDPQDAAYAARAGGGPLAPYRGAGGAVWQHEHLCPNVCVPCGA